jgi:S-adenosylmethionine hydrolase
MQSPAPSPVTIVFLSDFGRRDGYDAMMRGVMLSLIPPALRASVSCIDLSHEIPPQDIDAAVHVLASSHAYFPPDTVFVCVVDPHVGQLSQKKLLVWREDWRKGFIGPDNGLLTPALGAPEVTHVYSLENDALFWPQPKDIGRVFQGRDIYAPAAAHLSVHLLQGRPIADFLAFAGTPLTHPVRHHSLEPSRDEAGAILKGRVIRADHFGNLLTNVPNAWLSDHVGNWEVDVDGQHWVCRYLETFSHAEGLHHPQLIAGSDGCCQLALYGSNAQERHKIETGCALRIIRLEEPHR